MVHVCDDIACRARGAVTLCAALEAMAGPPLAHAPAGEHVPLDREKAAWMHAPCLGLCDVAPAALVVEAGETVVERSVGNASLDGVLALLAGAPAGSDGAGAPHAGRSAAMDTGGLLQRVGRVDPTSLAAYRAADGYAALAKAIGSRSRGA